MGNDNSKIEGLEKRLSDYEKKENKYYEDLQRTKKERESEKRRADDIKQMKEQADKVNAKAIESETRRADDIKRMKEQADKANAKAIESEKRRADDIKQMKEQADKANEKAIESEKRRADDIKRMKEQADEAHEKAIESKSREVTRLSEEMDKLRSQIKGLEDKEKKAAATPPPKLLTERPWRSLNPIAAQQEKNILEDIKKLKPQQYPGVLMLGPVGAGKSSFINSCLSVAAGRKRIKAQTGGDAGSFTLTQMYISPVNFIPVVFTGNILQFPSKSKFPWDWASSRLNILSPQETLFSAYKGLEWLEKIRFLDSMGIEGVSTRGIHEDDVTNLLQGHIKKGYKFNQDKPIDEKSDYYNENPKFEEKTHCVVFMIDATTMHADIPKEYVKKIKTVQTAIKNASIPRVLILTKCDRLCSKVQEDAENIFSSIKVERAVKAANEVFGIDISSIHPVINYEVDVELSTAKNIPILLALRQLLQYACDYIEDTLND